MSWNAEISGLDKITLWPEKLGGGIPKAVLQACQDSAESLEKEAKNHVYDGLTYQDGAIRDSIHAFCDNKGDAVEFGIGTGLDIAIYHEMGTGPVGTAAGYPGEAELDTPVSRRADGWVYQSEQAAEMRGEEYVEGEKGGFVYTEGVKPQAFMHNAAETLKDAIVETLAKAAGEVLDDDK